MSRFWDKGRFIFLSVLFFGLVLPINIFIQAEDISFVEQCASFGIWDKAGRTCFLDEDLTYGIDITESNLVLDCQGHSLSGEFDDWGIRLKGVNNVEIRSCQIKNFAWGIYLDNAFDNLITQNNITENGIGLMVGDGQDNRIFHNNFIDNSNFQVYVFESFILDPERVNYFDNGYPSGGNYWSDFLVRPGDFEVPVADRNGDGIWDSPYVFEGGQDSYPLVRQVDWRGAVCGDGICQNSETFEVCYQDCTTKGIEKYLPYWQFSKDEKYFPVSFYFDKDANTGNNYKNYQAESGVWDRPYVYIHTTEDNDYFTIQYWLYEVYNLWKGIPKITYTHEHEWDGVIYVVFDKDDFSKPAEIRYARHHFIGAYSWDEVQKIQQTHPLAYVAEGSHGAYPTTDMGSLDKFNPGGRKLGPDEFSWYYINDKGCPNEKEFEILLGNGEKIKRRFCRLKFELLKGFSQPQPDEIEEGYWPKSFFNQSGSLWSDAPWVSWLKKDRWNKTRPEGWFDWLEIGVGSPVELYVYDPLGQLVSDGSDYLVIPNPMSGDYRIVVAGLADGKYDLFVLRNKNEEVVYFRQLTGISIENGEVHNFAVSLTASPKQLIRKCLNNLESFETADRRLERKIDRSIGYLERALADLWWQDEWHLIPDLKASRVFSFQRRTARDLSTNSLFEENIQDLTLASQLLVRTAIEEAKIKDVQNKRLQKRFKRLIERAESEYQKGIQKDDIAAFARAWRLVQSALRLVK